MMRKRKFTAHAAALCTALILTTTPSFSAGGNDPIEGIDIIIKKNPGSHPIKPFSLDQDEIKTFNGLKDTAGLNFVLSTVAKRIDADDAFIQAGIKAYLDHGCPPMPWSHCGETINFKAKDTRYTLQLKFNSKAIARPTKMSVTAPQKPSPKLKELPKQ
jgi:hypothetical protein